MRIIIVCLLLVLVSGCAIFGDQIDKAAEATAKGVVAYCDNFTSDQRTIFGDKVRALTEPDSIVVTCED